MILNHKAKLAGISLVEVLAVLFLASTLLVGAAQMTARLQIIVKNNEIEDYANGLALKALEAAKAPANVIVQDAPGIPANFNGVYSLSLGSPNRLVYRGGTTTPPITNCPDASQYNVSPAGQQDVCVQLTITSQTNIAGISYFQINVLTVYDVSGRLDSQNLLGYRRGTFIKQ